ncbi:MAG: superoxide dismutase [Ni] [Candidatus Krumholzibacteria bacterium]|nr:superoxide dismutase [Ni] [Candidatus Krumholzibacteria bacterium]
MKRALVLMAIMLSFIGVRQMYAHCEVPCGIYDDPLRIALIREHITTIEKSMKMIVDLTGEDGKNYNQIVRWISNKEHHAEELQHIVWQYFMTQRIKPAAADDEEGRAAYLEQLTLLHELLIGAMKSKQTVDLTHVAAMRDVVDRFEASYLKGK